MRWATCQERLMASATDATAGVKGQRQTPSIEPAGRHTNSRRDGRHTGQKSSINWRLRHRTTGTPRTVNPTMRTGYYQSTADPAERRQGAPQYHQKHPQSARYAERGRPGGRTTGRKARYAPPAPGTVVWALSPPNNLRGDRHNKIKETVWDPQQDHRGYPGEAY